jgi:REP-associated tyrosine transposase
MTIPCRHSSPVKITSNSRTFFATSSIYDKRSLLQSQRSANLFVDVLFHYRNESNYLLHEFVVMPDHFHVLLTVGSQISIEKAMQFIKGGFAFRAARELGFHTPIWQKGFSETRVSEPGAYARFKNYIYENPVARGLALHASGFRFSSACRQWQMDPVPQGLKPSSESALIDTAEAVS